MGLKQSATPSVRDRSPRQQVRAKYPTADALKISIANWGVALVGTTRWLSYGQPTPQRAWRKALEEL